MKIVADAQIPYVNDYFGNDGELVLIPGRLISHADVKEADILLVRSVTPVTKQLLDQTAVKFVGSVTAGADHLQTTWLDEAGISWSTANSFNALAVAEYVICVVAALKHQHHLLSNDKPLKAAVIGVGNVGQLVSERLQLLNMDVIVCDPIRREIEKDTSFVPIEELSDVDFISLHVPLTKSGDHATFHMIDKSFLDRQKSGCILMNTSRGEVIHSAALLEHGTHLHWCLDVWEHEPEINKTILAQALVATPHIAGYSVQSKMRGIQTIHDIAVSKGILPLKAAQEKIIPTAREHASLSFPNQTLMLNKLNADWQEIVLQVFNPLIYTAKMRNLLLPATQLGPLFDKLRNQFNYRYEFGHTYLGFVSLLDSDKKILTALGFKQF